MSDCNIKTKPIYCRACRSKRFSDEEDYKTHWANNHADISLSSMYGNRLQCIHCGCYLPTIYSIELHKMKCLGQNVVAPSAPAAPSADNNESIGTILNQKAVITCRICGEIFAKPKLYEKHWSAKHADVDRSFMYEIKRQCKICERYFPTALTFTLHTAKCHTLSNMRSSNAIAILQNSKSDNSKVCKTENYENNESEWVDSTMTNDLASNMSFDSDTVASANGRTIKCEPTETGFCLIESQPTESGDCDVNESRRRNSTINSVIESTPTSNSANPMDDNFCINGRTIKCEPIETGFCLIGEQPNESGNFDINKPREVYSIKSTMQKTPTNSNAANLDLIIEGASSTTISTQSNCFSPIDYTASLSQLNSQLNFSDANFFGEAFHCAKQSQEPFSDDTTTNNATTQKQQTAGSGLASRTERAKKAKKERICTVCGQKIMTRMGYRRHFLSRHADRYEHEMFENGWKCRLCPWAGETLSGLQSHWYNNHHEVYNRESFRRFKNQRNKSKNAPADDNAAASTSNSSTHINQSTINYEPMEASVCSSGEQQTDFRVCDVNQQLRQIPTQQLTVPLRTYGYHFKHQHPFAAENNAATLLADHSKESSLRSSSQLQTSEDGGKKAKSDERNCTVCNAKIMTRYAYRRHFVTKHPDRPDHEMYESGWKCSLCSWAGETLNGLRSHWCDAHPDLYNSDSFRLFFKDQIKNQNATVGDDAVTMPAGAADYTVASTNNDFHINQRTIKCEPIETGVCLIGENPMETESGEYEVNQFRQRSTQQQSTVPLITYGYPFKHQHPFSAENNAASHLADHSEESELHSFSQDDNGRKSKSEERNCTVCNAKIMTRHAYRRHFATKHPDRPDHEMYESGWNCSVCSWAGEKLSGLRSHWCDAHPDLYDTDSFRQFFKDQIRNQNTLDVDDNMASTSNDFQINQHTIKRESVETDDCLIGEKSVTSEFGDSEIKQFRQLPTQQLTVSLTTYGYPFRSALHQKRAENAAKSHLTGHTKVRKPRSSSKIQHQMSAGGKKAKSEERICPVCSAQIMTRYAYRRHFVTMHPDHPEQDMYESGWKCSLCPWAGETLSGLQSHWTDAHPDRYDTESFRLFKDQIVC